MRFRTALAADFRREHEYSIEVFMEANNRNRGCLGCATGSVADTRELLMFLGDDGDVEAIRGP